MKAQLSSLSPRVLLAVAAGLVLVWAVLLWFLYVSPQRSAASRLGAELADAELQLAQAQAAAHHPSRSGSSTVSEVFRLAEAMPASGDQSSLVLELSRLAASSGVALRSISAQPSTEGAGGTTMIPVTVTIGGRFGQVTRFLGEARSLVTVRHGRLRASGRLLSVESVELAQSLTGGFPQLDATIVLDAYVYDGPIVPATPPSTGGTEGGSTTTPSGTTAAAGSTS